MEQLDGRSYLSVVIGSSSFTVPTAGSSVQPPFQQNSSPNSNSGEEALMGIAVSPIPHVEAMLAEVKTFSK